MQVGLRNLLAARRNFPSSFEAAAEAGKRQTLYTVAIHKHAKREKRKESDLHLTLVEAEVEIVRLIAAVSHDIALHE